MENTQTTDDPITNDPLFQKFHAVVSGQEDDVGGDPLFQKFHATLTRGTPAPDTSKDVGGFWAAAKSNIGETAKGVGQFGADYVPGVTQDNALKRWGQGVVEANPVAGGGTQGFLEHPWQSIKEFGGGMASGLGTAAGIGALGTGIAALPIPHPLGKAAAWAIGRGLQVAAPYIAFGAPAQSSIREQQIHDDPEAVDSLGSKLLATAGAGTVGAIVHHVGPAGQFGEKLMTQAGRSQLGKALTANTLPGEIAKGAGFGLAQGLLTSPVEQAAALHNPFTPDNLLQTADSAVSTAIGGGIFGGALKVGHRMLGKPASEASAPKNLLNPDEPVTGNNLLPGSVGGRSEYTVPPTIVYTDGSEGIDISPRTWDVGNAQRLAALQAKATGVPDEAPQALTPREAAEYQYLHEKERRIFPLPTDVGSAIAALRQGQYLPDGTLVAPAEGTWAAQVFGVARGILQAAGIDPDKVPPAEPPPASGEITKEGKAQAAAKKTAAQSSKKEVPSVEQSIGEQAVWGTDIPDDLKKDVFTSKGKLTAEAQRHADFLTSGTPAELQDLHRRLSAQAGNQKLKSRRPEWALPTLEAAMDRRGITYEPFDPSKPASATPVPATKAPEKPLAAATPVPATAPSATTVYDASGNVVRVVPHMEPGKANRGVKGGTIGQAIPFDKLDPKVREAVQDYLGVDEEGLNTGENKPMSLAALVKKHGEALGIKSAQGMKDLLVRHGYTDGTRERMLRQGGLDTVHVGDVRELDVGGEEGGGELNLAAGDEGQHDTTRHLSDEDPGYENDRGAVGASDLAEGGNLHVVRGAGAVADTETGKSYEAKLKTLGTSKEKPISGWDEAELAEAVRSGVLTPEQHIEAVRAMRAHETKYLVQKLIESQANPDSPAALAEVAALRKQREKAEAAPVAKAGTPVSDREQEAFVKRMMEAHAAARAIDARRRAEAEARRLTRPSEVAEAVEREIQKGAEALQRLAHIDGLSHEQIIARVRDSWDEYAHKERMDGNEVSAFEELSSLQQAEALQWYAKDTNLPAAERGGMLLYAKYDKVLTHGTDQRGRAQAQRSADEPSTEHAGERRPAEGPGIDASGQEARAERAAEPERRPNGEAPEDHGAGPAKQGLTRKGIVDAWHLAAEAEGFPSFAKLGPDEQRLLLAAEGKDHAALDEAVDTVAERLSNPAEKPVAADPELKVGRALEIIGEIQRGKREHVGELNTLLAEDPALAALVVERHGFKNLSALVDFVDAADKAGASKKKEQVTTVRFKDDATTGIASNESVLAGLRRIGEDDNLAYEDPAHVGSIMVTGIERQHDGSPGRASAVLDALVKWADEKGERLVLSAKASGELDQAGLEAWYERRGFVKDDAGYHVRTPKGENHAVAEAQAPAERVVQRKRVVKPEKPQVAVAEESGKLGKALAEALRQKPPERQDSREFSSEGKVLHPTDEATLRGTIAEVAGTDAHRKITVFATEKDAIDAGALPAADAHGTQAWVKGGRAYFIAENIPKGRELAVFLHEVGVHLGMEKTLGHGNYNRLLDQVETWYARGTGIEGEIATAAKKRVETAHKTTEGGLSEAQQKNELLAYFVEEAVKRGVDPTARQYNSELGRWFRTLWAAFKQAVRRMGFNPDKLSAQDVVDLAYGAAHKELQEAREVEKSDATTQFSKLADDKAIKNIDKLPDGPLKDATGRTYLGLKGAVRSGLLGSAFVHDVVDYAVEQGVGSARRWQELMESKNRTSRTLSAPLQEIASKANELQAHELSREGALSVNKLLNNISYSGKWAWQLPADSPLWKGRQVQVDPEMAKRFAALSPKAQEVARAAVDFGETMRQELEKQGIKIEAGEGPYLPHKRFGDWIVVSKSSEYARREALDDNSHHKLKDDPKHYNVQAFDNQWDARQARKQMEADPSFASGDVRLTKAEQYFSQIQLAPMQQIARLEHLINNSDLPNKIKAATASSLQTLYKQTLANTSARHAEQRRMNVAGADGDMLRALFTQGNASAALVAALAHAKDIEGAITAMRREAHDNDQEGRAKEALNELLNRHALSMVYKPTPVQNKLMQLTAFQKVITSPAFFLQQATEPFMMLAPVLAGHFRDYGGTMREMGSAFAQAFRTIGLNPLHTGSAPDKVLAAIKGHANSVGKDYEAIRELIETGRADVGNMNDFGAVSTKADSPVSYAFNQVMSKVARVATDMEEINRIASGLTSYRMKYKQLIAKGETAEAAHKEATAFVVQMVDRSHGNYAAWAAPRYMMQSNSNVPIRIFTQFRKFQVMGLSLLGRLIRDSFRGDSADDKAAARHALGYMTAQMALLAGGLGIPFAGVAADIASLFLRDDDEPWGRDTTELHLRRYIGNSDLAKLLLHGAPAAAGVDVSKRIGGAAMGDLAPYSELDLGSRKGFESTLPSVLGPFVGGTLPAAADAYKLMREGEYQKGMESLLPTGLVNASKAYRFAHEGVTNSKGDVLLKPGQLSGFDIASQALGLPSTHLTERQFKQGVLMEQEARWKELEDRYTHQYVKAVREKDSSAAAAAIQAYKGVQDSKRAMGGLGTPLSTLFKAPAEQIKRQTQNVGGIEVNRSTRGILTQMERQGI